MQKMSKLLLVGFVICLISFFITKFILGVWLPFLWVIVGLGAGCLAGALWLERALIVELFNMKTTKQGMSMGAHITLVFVILIAINFVAVRKYKTFDFSMARVNTLSDQSIKIVQGLTEDLDVIYLYKSGTEGVEANKRAFIDLLKKYQDQTDKLKLKFVEINEHPDLAEKYNIHQATQVVVLEYQGRQSRIEKIDEQEMTSGLVKVTRKTNKKVYVLNGHQELDLTAQKDGSSMSLLKDLLTNSRYIVAETSLTSANKIPDDADVLLIIGPRTGFLDMEVKALDEYLNRGGSLILALSAGFKTGLENTVLKMGILPKNNYVASLGMTSLGLAVDPSATRGSVFSPSHQITKPFGKNQFTVFRLPQALGKLDPLPSGMVVEDLVKTSDSVMAFKDTHFDASGTKGAVTLAYAVHGKWGSAATKEFNALVFGDPNAFNDQYLYQQLNRDLILNSVAFLAKEENLISISPKEIETTTLTMGDGQFMIFLFGFIIPLPLVLFGSSGWLWYRRRYS